MIKAIDFTQKNNSFRSQIIKVRESDVKPKDEKDELETRLLDNTLKTKIRQAAQKTESAFLDYPPKGLRGDVNSNFYQFLTMGIVPYLLGSAMFMVGFNCVNNVLDLFSKKAASNYGKKMALGVVFYGVMKTLSKQLVTVPVKQATGVDVDMPYENVYCLLPTKRADEAEPEHVVEQRKVFDSKEFYRKDKLDRSYFDGVAKKLGLGKDLNDSITETNPIIQNIVATAGMAKSISSYFWAAVGVGLATRPSWNHFFEAISNRKRHNFVENKSLFENLGDRCRVIGENLVSGTKAFGKAFTSSCKMMWQGKANTKSLYQKHWGKVLILAAAAATTGLTANSIIRAKNMAKNNNKQTIDRSKESTVI
ncbi:hypothetical protein IJD34_02440 [bacterium]|nr:hypothetical protein [bacterium]